MKLFGIYGASGCGRGVIPVAREMLGRQEGAKLELVFVDDQPLSERINGHRVLTYQQFLDSEADDKKINVAIANSAIRQKLTERCSAGGIGFFSVVAANSVVLDGNYFAEGLILCPFVTVTSNTSIGKHFHANIYSYVEHDCVIGDFVTFAPSVKCNGNVVIEDHAYIGTGAILRQGRPGEPLVIGRGAVVGMGSVVTRSVPPGATVVGNPARIMER